MQDEYYELYSKLLKELREISDEIRPYYDIDKVKIYSVYIWTKDSFDLDNTEMIDDNLFDIQAHELIMYDKNHIIIEEAIPIIEKIQDKLKEIEVELKLNKER